MFNQPITAIVRPISASIAKCELTHIDREPINLKRARAQHRQLLDTLTNLGVTIEELPLLDDQPDAVFVEDTAIVLDEMAVITRPGAIIRRGELATVSQALAKHRELATLRAPATLDGGDVIVNGRTIFVGLTSRSNSDGIAQLQEITRPWGYVVSGVRVNGCLHLKSAVTRIAADTYVGKPEFYDSSAMGGTHFATAAGEDAAANTCVVNDILIFPAGNPTTESKLRNAGFDLRVVAADELAKAEGAITCCSLLIPHRSQ